MTEAPVDWVKRRMREKGLKQVDLANALGVLPNKITKAFYGERQFKLAEMDILRALLAEDDAPPPPGKPTVKIPVVGDVPGGNWREARQNPIGHITPPDDTPPNALALRVTGDSMDKFVRDGGYVIFDPDDRSLFPGLLYVVMNGDGETTFKQFLADPARLEPCSNNPEHKAIIIGDGTFQIVGRVIGSFNRY